MMKKSRIYFVLLICFFTCFKVPAYAVKFTGTAFKHLVIVKTSQVFVKLAPQYVHGNLEVFVRPSVGGWQVGSDSTDPLIAHQSFLENQNIHFSYQLQQGGIEGGGCRLIYSYYNLQNMTVTQIAYQIPGNFYVYGPFLLQWYMDMPAGWTPGSSVYPVIDPLQEHILGLNFGLLNSMSDGTAINGGEHSGETTLQSFEARLREKQNRSGSSLLVRAANGMQGLQWEGFELKYHATGERNNRTVNISSSIEAPPSQSTATHNVSYSLSVSGITDAHFLNNINWERQTAPGTQQLQRLHLMQRLELDWRHILALIIVLAAGKYFFGFSLF